jgi:hypothetical protein
MENVVELAGAALTEYLTRIPESSSDYPSDTEEVGEALIHKYQPRYA